MLIPQSKNNDNRKKLPFAAFFLIFMLPNHSQYKKFGLNFSGDLNLDSSSKISTFDKTF